VEQDVHLINPSVQTLAVGADMTDEQSVEGLFEKVKATFGHADVMVVSAGLNSAKPVIHENSVDDFWNNFVCFLGLTSFTLFPQLTLIVRT
jgi:NAD(P)-dependent dehydrogenase (short-subunit alcohol dehydrogenase family)